MALDWDNIEIIAEDENIVRLSEWSSIEIVTEDEEIIKTSDNDIINMDACDRMIIFSGQPGQPGPQGPEGPQGPPGYGAEWGNIGGTLSAQTDLQNALNAKANTADLGSLAYQSSVDYSSEVTNKPTLGTMAAVNDAPSDNKEYARKNGNWTEVTGGGGGGSAEWGDITGTLSDQTDLQDALNAKANTADLGDLAGMDSIDYTSAYLTNKPTLGSLASKNSVDYDTEVTNKPTLGSLAALSSIDYTSAYLTNKPTLGTMSAVNDATSDGKAYARKDGAWYDLDGRYYTEAEVDSALSAKADTSTLDDILACFGLVYYSGGIYVDPDQS